MHRRYTLASHKPLPPLSFSADQQCQPAPWKLCGDTIRLAAFRATRHATAAYCGTRPRLRAGPEGVAAAQEAASCMLAIARNARNAAATCKMRRRGVPCLLDHSVHVVRGMLHGRSVYVACCMLYGRRRELAAPRQSAGMVARKPVCPRGQTGRSRGERPRWQRDVRSPSEDRHRVRPVDGHSHAQRASSRGARRLRRLEGVPLEYP